MSSANVEPTPVNNRVAADGNSARTALPTMGLLDRVEAWLSRVSMKSNLVRKACA